MNRNLRESVEFIRHLINNGGPEEKEYDNLTRCFNNFYYAIKRGIIDYDDIPKYWTSFRKVFLTVNTMQGFVVLKPHGYAGDFEIIDRIYQKWCSPDKGLTKWDLYFHERAAVKAVRNRKKYFINTMSKLAKEKNGALSILNVGSGSGRDMKELFESLDESNISIDCVDIDKKAIQYALKLNKKNATKLNFIHKNILRFNPQKRYDVIWSAGVFDYLSDKVFLYLLKRFQKWIKKRGYIILGNFSLKNPTRPYMEFGHWFLIHRSAEMLVDLATKANLSYRQIAVESEPQGVNLFLKIKF